jgi:hypothetical protein
MLSSERGYFRPAYLSDIAWLPLLEESYFRNNADLGTGLLMANLAITSPHFFAFRVLFSWNRLHSLSYFRISATQRVLGFSRPTSSEFGNTWRLERA